MNTDTIETAPPAGTTGEDVAADIQEMDPLLQSAGRYKDDPFWDEMMDSIRRHRREMDAEWDVPDMEEGGQGKEGRGTPPLHHADGHASGSL